MPARRADEIELNSKLQGNGEAAIILINCLADDLGTELLQVDDTRAAGHSAASSPQGGIMPRYALPRLFGALPLLTVVAALSLLFTAFGQSTTGPRVSSGLSTAWHTEGAAYAPRMGRQRTGTMAVAALPSGDT